MTAWPSTICHHLQGNGNDWVLSSSPLAQTLLLAGAPSTSAQTPPPPLTPLWRAPQHPWPPCRDGPAWWVSGRGGMLPPWSLAQVWALHAVSEMRHLDLEHAEIAEAVDKVGGGKPTAMAICHLRSLFEADREWYPGKSRVVGKRPGPKPTFTTRKSHAHVVGHATSPRQSWN